MQLKVNKSMRVQARVNLKGTVTVTQGLLDMLTHEELHAVLLHEETHYMEKHIPIQLGFKLVRAALFNAANLQLQRGNQESAMRLVKLALCMQPAGWALSHYCEKRADEGARKAGYGPQLANALVKIGAKNRLNYYPNPTHPRIKVRVQRLSK